MTVGAVLGATRFRRTRRAAAAAIGLLVPVAAAAACADRGVGGDAARGGDAIGVTAVDESVANDAGGAPVGAGISDLVVDHEAVGNAGQAENDSEGGVGASGAQSSPPPPPVSEETLVERANQPSISGDGGSAGPTTSQHAVPTTAKPAGAAELDQIVDQLEAEVADLEQELNQLG